MNYSIHRDVFTGKYYTTLLGGEFDNCHGEGDTVEGAVGALRFLVSWKRRKRANGGRVPDLSQRQDIR